MTLLMGVAQAGQWEGALTKPLLQASQIILPNFLHDSMSLCQRLVALPLRVMWMQISDALLAEASATAQVRCLPWCWLCELHAL